MLDRVRGAVATSTTIRAAADDGRTADDDAPSRTSRRPAESTVAGLTVTAVGGGPRCSTTTRRLRNGDVEVAPIESGDGRAAAASAYARLRNRRHERRRSEHLGER